MEKDQIIQALEGMLRDAKGGVAMATAEKYEARARLEVYEEQEKKLTNLIANCKCGGL